MSAVDSGVFLAGLHRPPSTLPRGIGAGYSPSPLENLLDHGWLSVPAMDARAFYGISPSMVTQTHAAEWGLLEEPAYRGVSDWQNYAFPLGEMFHRGLASYPSNVPSGDNQVKILKIKGHLRPAGTGLYTVYDQDLPYYGETLRISSKYIPNLGIPCYVNTSGTTFPGVTVGVAYYRPAWGNVITLLDQFAAMFDGHTAGYDIDDPLGGPPLWCNGDFISNTGCGSSKPKFNVGERFLDVSYVGFRYGAWGLRYDRNIRYEILDDLPTHSGYNVYGGETTLRLRVTYTDRSTYCVLANNEDPIHPVYKPDGEEELSVWSIETSVPGRGPGWQVPTSTSFDIDDDELSKQVHGLLRDIDSSLSPLGPDIRAGALLSTKDAVEKMKEESNWFEALAELPEIAALISGPLELIGSLGSALLALDPRSWRSLALLLGVLADLLSSGILLFSFGIKPTLQDSENLAQAAQRARLVAGLVARGFTARGKHSIVLNFDDVPFKLTIRSKVRFPPPTTEAFVEAFRLDNQGGLFTAKRGWNALPFTFIIDYGLGMGERFSAIETYIFCCMMNALNFTHSFLLETDKFPTPAGYEVRDGALKLSYYVREISACIPDPTRSSRFNFLPPRRPSIAVLLSLLFQIVKAFV